MELVQVGEKTYYIKNATNIGIYKLNDTEVYLIDSGNDKDAGKKILKIIDEHGWKVKGIINTHSHADHIGGNQLIQERTKCSVLGYGIENMLIENTELEPAFLYGGFPLQELENNKFLKAKPSNTKEIEGNLADGLETFSLKGHYFDMIGVKTSDNVYFLGDSIINKETIEKYHIFFLYDIEQYLQTLIFLENLQGVLFIPSHIEGMKDLKEVIELNRKKIEEICEVLLEICEELITFEEILAKVFKHYDLKMNVNQYVLVGCTIKSYLSYFTRRGKLQYMFENNKMLWKRKEITNG